MKIAFKRHDKRNDSEKEEKEKQPVLDGLEWEMCKGDLRLQMTRAVFDMWLKPTFGYRDGDVMVVEAHNPFAYEWLSIRLLGMIERVVAYVCGEDVDVRIQEAP
jgi:chromosomal replication initiation ATPase DnaA